MYKCSKVVLPHTTNCGKGRVCTMEEGAGVIAKAEPDAGGSTGQGLHGVLTRTRSKDVEGSPKHKPAEEAKKRHSLGAVEESSSRSRPKLLKLPFLDEIKSRRVGKLQA